MKLSFHGAVEGVTGSAYLLETPEARLMLDCGMFQGERFCSRKNFDPLGFDASRIDAVIITHAHYDHTGRLPLMVKQGFSGAVYATPPTKDLMELILRDAVNVMAEEAHKCGTETLYDLPDVERAMSLVRAVNYHTEFTPAPRLHATFHNAGHILGSAFVRIRGDKTIVFSGDIGRNDVPVLPDVEAIESADAIICESTYGNRDHEPITERANKLRAFVEKILGQGGTLLIPAFSIERTQELLYELDALADSGAIPPGTPVYLDSPLAIRSNDVYRKYADYLEIDRPISSSPDGDFFVFDGLKTTLSVDDSKKINADARPKIIIAGSGMMNGGRILHHAMRYLSDEKSGVLIIGYQAEGTLGRKIENGAAIVDIYKETVPVRAAVESIHAFSSHADRSALAAWLAPRNGRAPKTFLVHGDEEVKPSFKKFLETKLDSEIIIPKLGESFVL